MDLTHATGAGAMTRTEETVEAAAGGTAGTRSLESFFGAHYARLVGLAGVVCGDRASAEDIVQTALERAWRSRASLADEGALRPWLDRIVVREAARERSSRRSLLARLVRPPAVREIEPSGEVVGRREPADESARWSSEGVALRDAFDRLTPGHRAVVVLHLHAGFTVDETARELGIPRETVRSRLRVARQQLRRTLEEDPS